MTMNATPHALLVRAALAQRLASCFRYPESGAARAIRAGLAQIATAASQYPDVAGCAERLRAAFAAATDEALQVEYSRLFIGASAAPLHETAYGPPRLTTAAELADVQGFYHAFGFELSDATPDMADHLGAELEFHAALLVKLAWAMQQEWGEPSDITNRAAAAFLDAHLGRWTAALAGRLVAAAPDSLYGRAAVEADAFLTTECARFGVTPAPLPLRDRGAEPEAFTCPHAADCGTVMPADLQPAPAERSRRVLDPR
jgi:putative dimethyl sulfoxide reductase chaperone